MKAEKLTKKPEAEMRPAKGQKLNAMRESETKSQYATAGMASGLGGYAQCQDNQPGNPSLLDRVSQQIAEARRQANKAERLMELGELLRKHPDVARILDLLDAEHLR